MSLWIVISERLFSLSDDMHQCPPVATPLMRQSNGGGLWKHNPKPSFQISWTWQVSTSWNSVTCTVDWIKTVCCRSKDHFHWTALLYPLYPPGPKSGGYCPPHTPVAPPMVKVRGQRGSAPLLPFEPPCYSMSPPIVSIKSYFMPK